MRERAEVFIVSCVSLALWQTQVMGEEDGGLVVAQEMGEEDGGLVVAQKMNEEDGGLVVAWMVKMCH